jgi:23S rRNA pseudouridine1911/1915/1917 synthase
MVEGTIEPPEGRLIDYLRKDERHRRVHAVAGDTPGAQFAELHYRTIGSLPGEPQLQDRSATLLEVRPHTGRKHQIRVQLSQAGFPILGDRKYGSLRRFPTGIALHARRLVARHPVSKMQMEFEAPLPAAWKSLVAERR